MNEMVNTSMFPRAIRKRNACVATAAKPYVSVVEAVRQK